jgi:hypothetical protein
MRKKNASKWRNRKKNGRREREREIMQNAFLVDDKWMYYTEYKQGMLQGNLRYTFFLSDET